MKALFKNAEIYGIGKNTKCDFLFDGAALSVSEGKLSPMDFVPAFDNTVIFPGFCDVHVHLREPGFSYKETIKSGTMAAARGGYTAVCSMPNLSPTPDTRENLTVQLDIIERDACIKVIPYGAITVGQRGEQLSDMEGMRDFVAGYSDDGRGVQSEDMMLAAMTEAKRLGRPIVAHCEDNTLLHGGYIHDGEYAKLHGHRGISSESEWRQIERDIELVKRTGCAYHVCHISTKESVELIRRAKREGVDITCETAPHYILLDESALTEDARFKMNPPLRSPDDREAILEGIIDGTIDMIATDHAPHSAEEKSRGLEKSAMGIVGIETAFPLVYTYLIKTGIISMERAIELFSLAPRRRFGISSDKGFTVFKLTKAKKINPDEFLSMGKSTPFLNTSVEAECILTVYDGKPVYDGISK